MTNHTFKYIGGSLNGTENTQPIEHLQDREMILDTETREPREWYARDESRSSADMSCMFWQGPVLNRTHANQILTGHAKPRFATAKFRSA